MSRTWHKDRVEKIRGSKRWDSSCANHGSCPWCQGNRTFFDTKARDVYSEEDFTYTSHHSSIIDDSNDFPTQEELSNENDQD